MVPPPIWSDGYASQFRSQFVFKSLLSYDENLKIYWNYGEAHHFKGPHDGIGGTIKRKIYQDVSSNKIVIESAKEFAEYANKVTSIEVYHLPKDEIIVPDITGSKYIKGTLSIHHVERINLSKICF